MLVNRLDSITESHPQNGLCDDYRTRQARDYWTAVVDLRKALHEYVGIATTLAGP